MRLLGMQGWDYMEWVGHFYVAGTRRADRLACYAREFPTVEVGQTFFGVPPGPVVKEWRDAVPPDFVFSIRVPRQVTHERPVGQSSSILRRFLDRAAVLEQRLGPLLLTLPVGFGPTSDNRALLRRFVRSLPRDFMWTIEVRWPEWLEGDAPIWLGEHGVAVALVEDRWVRRSLAMAVAGQSTSRFAYVRWNSVRDPQVSYRGEYSPHDALLRLWSRALETLPEQVEQVFGYFSPSFGGDGLRGAQAVRRMPVQDPVAVIP